MVDAVAARTGGPVVLWGHSYGANCAMGGAALSDNVSHLVCTSRASACRIRRAPSTASKPPSPRRPRRSDHRRARRHPGDDRRGDRRLPGQPAVAGAAGGRTDRREGVPRRAGLGVPARPVRRHHRADADADRIRQRLRSSPSATTRAAAAIPQAEVLVLDGHGHFAHKTDPAMVTDIVVRFMASLPASGEGSGD